MKYHCYTVYHDDVYRDDVEAGSPVEAAAKVAKESGIPGLWTVVPGEPSDVDVAWDGTDSGWVITAGTGDQS